MGQTSSPIQTQGDYIDGWRWRQNDGILSSVCFYRLYLLVFDDFQANFPPTWGEQMQYITTSTT